MAEIVNLRLVRKARTRAQAEATAEENRIRFGRSKAERKAQAAERDRAERAVVGHKLERKPDGE